MSFAARALVRGARQVAAASGIARAAGAAPAAVGFQKMSFANAVEKEVYCRQRPSIILENRVPVVSVDARVAGNAVIVGDVDIDDKVSIWHGAVLRGDLNFIRVQPYAAILERAVLHAARSSPVSSSPSFAQMTAGYAADGGEVRVTKSIDDVRAAEGMKLFEQENAAVVEYDQAAAQKYLDECEAAIKAMEEEVKLLTGKENKKAQTDKKKAIAAAKNDPKYIDATKVVKGLEPKNGNFIKSKVEAKKPVKKEEPKPVEEPKKEEPKKVEKDDKKAKKQESAGISKEERQELEDLKNKIIARKSELKAQGFSGGQQNKDPEVAGMVKRMNELKEKESPGSTQKAGKDAFKAKGMGKKCEGGMKAQFEVGKKAEAIADEMAAIVSDQIQDFMPNKESLLPMDGDMEAMVMFDDIEMIEDAEEGFSKTVEFGGFMKVGWGCKVTFEKKDGKFSKKSECGFSGVGGMGPKKPEMDEEFPSFD